MKPCPFVNVRKNCGHAVYIAETAGILSVRCSCGARGPMMATEAQAETAWDTRKDLAKWLPSQKGER